MSYDGHSNDIDFDKDIDINVDFNLDSDVEISFDKDVSVDVYVDSHVEVDGNFAQVTFDAQAVGNDGLVQADLVVLTIEDQLAMVSGSIMSATG